MQSAVAALASADPAEAAEALRSLGARLLPPTGAAAELLDEHSFELFEPLVAIAAGPHPAELCGTASELLAAIAAVASAREVVVMILGVLSTHPQPRAQCSALRLLPAVLPRLRRRRVQMLSSCLGAVADRYLAPGAWPADAWADADEEDEQEEPVGKAAGPLPVAGDGTAAVAHPIARSSEELLSLLIDCAASLCAAGGPAHVPPTAGAVPPADESERHLLLRFLFLVLERAHALGRTADESRAIASLSALAPPLQWLHGEARGAGAGGAGPPGGESAAGCGGAAGCEVRAVDVDGGGGGGGGGWGWGAG